MPHSTVTQDHSVTWEPSLFECVIFCSKPVQSTAVAFPYPGCKNNQKRIPETFCNPLELGKRSAYLLTMIKHAFSFFVLGRREGCSVTLFFLYENIVPKYSFIFMKPRACFVLCSHKTDGQTNTTDSIGPRIIRMDQTSVLCLSDELADYSD